MNIRLREFCTYDYKDPTAWLRALQEIEPRIAGSNLPYKVRSLRTHRLRRWNESRQAALFAYGIAQRLPDSYVDFAVVENADYDAVIRCRRAEECYFTPLQLKELVPDNIADERTTLESIFEKLLRYGDSSDLVVAIFLNRRFRGPIGSLPPLKLGGVYFFGAADPKSSTWQLVGDVLSESGSISTFAYPS